MSGTSIARMRKIIAENRKKSGDAPVKRKCCRGINGFHTANCAKRGKK